MVLLALIRLGDDAYGVPISQVMEESTEREILVGSVYAASLRQNHTAPLFGHRDNLEAGRLTIAIA